MASTSHSSPNPSSHPPSDRILLRIFGPVLDRPFDSRPLIFPPPFAPLSLVSGLLDRRCNRHVVRVRSGRGWVHTLLDPPFRTGRDPNDDEARGEENERVPGGGRHPIPVRTVSRSIRKDRSWTAVFHPGARFLGGPGSMEGFRTRSSVGFPGSKRPRKGNAFGSSWDGRRNDHLKSDLMAELSPDLRKGETTPFPA